MAAGWVTALRCRKIGCVLSPQKVFAIQDLQWRNCAGWFRHVVKNYDSGQKNNVVEPRKLDSLQLNPLHMAFLAPSHIWPRFLQVGTRLDLELTGTYSETSRAPDSMPHFLRLRKPQAFTYIDQGLSERIIDNNWATPARIDCM
jgi:hypothetical protein